MNCEHTLILDETSKKYICFICLECNKAESINPVKNFSCSCGNNSTDCWKFDTLSKCIYCSDCKKIIVD